MNIRRTVIFFLFFSSRLFAQYNEDITPHEANSIYFKAARETVFLHLNKSAYISGEEIWFKGYVYDRKNKKPFLKTSNFNIEIFNYKGAEVYSGLFLGYQGITKGNILVDSTWTSGTYYIRVSTNWMNNFVEDNSYTKKFKLINTTTNTVKKKEGGEYDFQLFPEGGHLISETKNTVGFKITNQRGYGVGYSEGAVVDEMGAVVKSFKSNKRGIGKFDIHLKMGKKYKAILKLKNGKEIDAEFPEIKNKGIALSANNLFPEKAVLELNWNTNKKKDLKEKRYYLLVHQNHLSKKIIVNFPSDDTNRTIFLDRKEMFPGVNTITLFEEDIPILERLLYNTSDTLLTNVNVSYLNKVKDSLIFSLNLPPKPEVAYDLSISILPKETKSYNFDDNIFSAMLLKPYVKGHIEESKYYFTNIDRRKIYDLDLLLLTQGWSKYEWKNKFDHKPNYPYGFNQGLTLKGTIQGSNNKDLKQVYLFPTKNNSYRLIDLDSTRSFSIGNFFAERNEDITLSALNSRGLPTKIGCYVTINQNRYKKPLVKELVSSSSDNINFIEGNIKAPKGFFKDFEVLEEVLIKGKKSENKEVNDQSFFYRENSEKITEKDAQVYQNVLDYIRIKSGKFRVRVNIETQTVSISSRSQITLLNNNETAIYIDDVLIGDPSILLTIAMQEVESVYMDGSGFGEGLRGAGGVIKIYTRRTALENISLPQGMNGVVSKHKAKIGFEPVKSFYRPAYSNYLDQFFIDYGVIHWEPQLLIYENGSSVIKVPNTQLENITFYIEGIGSDGSLVSKAITKNIKPNN